MRAYSRLYLVLDLIGSTVLMALAWCEEQWGFLLLEAVWAMVSAWGRSSLREASPPARPTRQLTGITAMPLASAPRAGRGGLALALFDVLVLAGTLLPFSTPRGGIWIDLLLRVTRSDYLRDG